MRLIGWTGLGFALAAILLCAALAWITAAAWNAERAERVRLALWRIDSTLTPFLAGENARSDLTFSRDAGDAGATIAANPLVRLYFQIDAAGRVTRFPATGATEDHLPGDPRELRRALAQAAASAVDLPPPSDPYAMPEPVRDREDEFARRNQVVMQNANLLQQSPLAARPPGSAGPFVPVWVEGNLFLARRLGAPDLEVVQACWLDWPRIQEVLRSQSEDLLPGARWVAVEPVDEGSAARRLASLPVRVELPTGPWWGWAAESPFAWSLILAWALAVLALAALGALLFGALALSERRATFVSAVTHELRTPITTLRMYAEMLAAGMVVGEEKQRDYLETMRAEADRLGHLVENVLAYARIEHGRGTSGTAGVAKETSSLMERLQCVLPRLVARCQASGKRLEVTVADAAASVPIAVDPIGFEQILFNLVDNACKYGADDRIRAVQLSAKQAGNRVEILVRDHGPGLSAGARRALFRPFSKSDQAAAESAPGVGLGLALCRRLARAMGGELNLDPAATPGATFCLTLPRASPDSANV